MFIDTDKYTINTDNIVWVEEKQDGTTEVVFANGKSLRLQTVEVRAIIAAAREELNKNSN